MQERFNNDKTPRRPLTEEELFDKQEQEEELFELLLSELKATRTKIQESDFFPHGADSGRKLIDVSSNILGELNMSLHSKFGDSKEQNFFDKPYQPRETSTLAFEFISRNNIDASMLHDSLSDDPYDYSLVTRIESPIALASMPAEYQEEAYRALLENKFFDNREDIAALEYACAEDLSLLDIETLEVTANEIVETRFDIDPRRHAISRSYDFSYTIHTHGDEIAEIEGEFYDSNRDEPEPVQAEAINSAEDKFEEIIDTELNYDPNAELGLSTSQLVKFLHKAVTNLKNT